jgi:hypothetical protein
MNDMLLIDCVGYSKLSLIESVNGSLRFEGIYQRADEINKNKRRYPKSVLESNVEKLNETIENRGLYGELDHPSDSIVHLANASHLITKLWWEGNELHGQSEVLNTPAGKVLKSLIESGVRVGISSRGVGNGQVNEEGVLVIGDSYKLITFDCVADPSTFSAFQSKVIGKRESVEPTPNTTKKINPKTFISYFGHMLQKKIEEKKEKI